MAEALTAVVEALAAGVVSTAASLVVAASMAVGTLMVEADIAVVEASTAAMVAAEPVRHTEMDTEERADIHPRGAVRARGGVGARKRGVLALAEQARARAAGRSTKRFATGSGTRLEGRTVRLDRRRPRTGDRRRALRRGVMALTISDAAAFMADAASMAGVGVGVILASAGDLVLAGAGVGAGTLAGLRFGIGRLTGIALGGSTIHGGMAIRAWEEPGCY